MQVEKVSGRINAHICIRSLGAVVSLLGAIVCSKSPPDAIERDQQLVSAVILDIVAGLDDSATASTFPPDLAPTIDSARALNRATWIGWWHTLNENSVSISDSLRVRFSQHFSLAAPPPDPWSEIDSHYTVDGVHIEDDSTLRASVGVSFARCTYRFRLRRGRWYLAGDDPTGCFIS